jgi:hypothetical protein
MKSSYRWVQNWNKDLGGMRALVEASPCAMSLWSGDRTFCLLNQSAKHLINYTEADFLQRRSLWVERIHPDDQQNFSRSQKALTAGNSPVQCDYRFLPRNACRPVWLREVSALDTSHGKVPWDIFSTYIDISDLKANNKANNAVEINEDDVTNFTKLLRHELSNCVQKVIMELEFAKLGVKKNPNSSDLVSAVEAVNRSVLSLQDQLVRRLETFVPQDPSALLDVTVQKLRKELHRHRVNLRLVRRAPLPMVRGDRDQLLSAFEQIFEYCGAMLKEGGNLEVEAGPKEVGGQLYAEVKVMGTSAVSFEPGDGGAFQSFGRVEGREIGLGIGLAAEILRRYRGQVSFRREGKNQGEVTILIKASPN